MPNEEWKMGIFLAFWEYLNFKIVDFGKSTPSDFFVHRVQDLDAIENLHKRINQKVKPNFYLFIFFANINFLPYQLFPEQKKNLGFLSRLRPI